MEIVIHNKMDCVYAFTMVLSGVVKKDHSGIADSPKKVPFRETHNLTYSYDSIMLQSKCNFRIKIFNYLF